MMRLNIEYYFDDYMFAPSVATFRMMRLAARDEATPRQSSHGQSL